MVYAIREKQQSGDWLTAECLETSCTTTGLEGLVCKGSKCNRLVFESRSLARELARLLNTHPNFPHYVVVIRIPE